jgi:VIT1/CCC1 family predicted Fe2+/Mn2+ transporter
VIGVASAGSSKIIILTAGIAGIVAGAMSMGVGEYLSVSTLRDNEEALIDKERHELEDNPKLELAELVSLYEDKGLDHKTALIVAKELTRVDVFATHADVELHIDPNNLTNPWHAVTASAESYIAGALIPLVAIMLPLGILSIPVTFVSVIVALTITGYTCARISGANIFKSTLRVVIGGAIAMSATYIIGRLFNIAGL